MFIRRENAESIDFEGLRIYDYTAGLETRSSVALVVVPPGVRHREAWSRRSDKHYIVTAGRVRFGVDGDESELAAGDFCLVRRGQRFWYENAAEESATLVLVHTPPFDLDAEVFVEDGQHKT